MTPLPKKYAYLAAGDMPRVIKEWLKIHGTLEAPGARDNPEILRWAREIGLGHIYKHDSTAWCGLVVAFVVAQAGFDHAPRGNALWARNWLFWGTPVPFGEEKIGDTLIKARGGAGHVCTYVGEDATHFHAFGGNQSDAVSIKRIPKIRTGKDAFLGARRCPWRVSEPKGVRKMWLDGGGPTGGSEA